MMLLKNRIRVVACNSEISCGKAGRSSTDVTPVDRLLIPCEPFPVARGLEQNKGLSNVRRCAQIHAGHKSVSFFLAKFCFVLFLFPHLRNTALFQESHAMLGLFCVYFAFILLWKINFPNEISKRNLGRLLCEKKIYSATIQILPNFVRFLNYIELFWEKVAFLFFQGREMSRVYIYIYIYKYLYSG